MFQLNTLTNGYLSRMMHLAAAAAALLCVMPAELPGQIILQGNGRFLPRAGVPLPLQPGGNAADEDEDEDNGRLTPRVAVDRELKKRIDMASSALERKDYRAVVEIIQRGILDRVPASGSASADYFLDQEMQHSLLRTARSLIAGLPPEGRRIYELQYGVTARQLLEKAGATQDLDALEEVVRRYFHTRAGYEAAWLLGSLNLDRGEPLAAARHFEQLRRLPRAVRPREPLLSLKASLAWAQAGMKDRALQILGDLAPELNAGSGQVKRTPEETLVWLQEVMGQNRELSPAMQEIWDVFGGSATRNGSILPASPVWQTEWEYPTIQRPNAKDPRQYEFVEQRLLELAAQRNESGQIALPVAHPLVVGDTVIFRTLSNIRAVDRRSGRRLWENFFVSPAWTHLVEEGHNEAVPVGNRQQSPLDMFLSQRVWQNLTSGTLSTDGSLIFAVESLGFVGPWPAQPGMPAHRLSAGDSNRLVACELATGRLSWELGGTRGDAELELAGAFFLGPPLPLGGSLYCLAEVSGELRLLVLDAGTGELQWWQSLLLSEDPLLQSPERRFSGVGVAAGDGVMICPTAAGAVIAIDLATRELLWGYRYRQPQAPVDSSNLVMMRMQQAMMQGRGLLNEEDEHWQDSTPVIAGGHVLLTPADASQLYCLRLSDGQLEWSLPRGQGLYLAGVHENLAIVVSRTQVEAFDLSRNGEPAWKEPVPIPVPGGRGVRSGRFYYLPLSTSEIATIDLETGRILARSPAPAGASPGNLVAAGGGLVSQSATGLSGFTPLNTLQQSLAARLQQNSRDAEALALRGELRLHSGEEQAGLNDLRQALEIHPDAERAKQALASTLLDRLRTDFAAYRDTVPEVGQLIDDPRLRWAFHRQNAAGLADAGEYVAAFQELERFAGPETSTSGLRPLDGDLLLRGDRWFRSQAESVFQRATPAQQTAMNQQIQQTLDRVLARATRDPAADQPVNRQIPVVAPRPGDREQALKQRETAALWRLLQYYEPLPGAETIRVALFERLSGKGNRLQREQLLDQLRSSQNPELAARATFELASLRLGQQDRPNVSALVEDLATRYENVLLPDGTPAGRRAAQLKALLQTDRPAASVWPRRKLTATRTPRRGSVQHHYAVDILGDPGPHFAGWRLELDQQRHFLSAFDANGSKRWSLPLKGLRDSKNRVLQPPQNLGNYARIHGHLVAVVLGGTLLCLDGLPREGGTPEVLWSRPLYEQLPDSQFRNNITVRQVMVGAGLRKIVVADPWGRPIGRLGVVSQDVVACQQGTSLFGVDPMTGSTLWERKNIARGSQIFGDGKYVFASSAGAGQAIMLDAATGEYAGSPLLPRGNSLVTARGRMLVLQEAAEQPGQVSLRGVDAAAAETRWTRVVEEGTQFEVIDGVEIAALQPSGQFEILEISTGATRVDAMLQPEQNLSQIIVRRDESSYVLMTQQPDNGRNNVRAVAIGMNNPLVNGHVYGFRRDDGSLIWSRAVKQQAFDLSQPNSLPVLIFTVRTYQLFRQGRSFNPNQFSVMVLDKRNGQLVFEESGSESLAPYELETNAAAGTIEVRFYRSQLEIKAGDEPLDSPVLVQAPAGQREPVEAPVPAQ